MFATGLAHIIWGKRRGKNQYQEFNEILCFPVLQIPLKYIACFSSYLVYKITTQVIFVKKHRTGVQLESSW